LINKDIDTLEKMSAFITHEINTPLTYLKAHLELMECDAKVIESFEFKRDFKDSKKKMQQAIKEIEKIVNVVHSATKDTCDK